MQSRPNILWYCTDQQRFDTIAALGNQYINTPNLDRFVAESAAFTHAFCQSPICTPSRASFLTGMYPSAVGVNGNGFRSFPRHFEDRLVSKVLRDAGYDCGLIGKLHLASAFLRREERVDDGYDYFQYSHDHKGGNEPGNEYVEWIKGQGIDHNSVLQPRGIASLDDYRNSHQHHGFGGFMEPKAEQDNVPPHLHQTYWCTEKAIEFIGRNREPDRPWLLSVNPFDPHPPFDAPYEYYRRYDPETLPGAHFLDSDLEHQRRLQDAGIDFQNVARHPDELGHKHIQASYYAMIEFLDHEFGRLIDFLDESGQRENTIVIFMSDHGETLGDHGLALKGCRFYEGLTRVPLLISWLGQVQPGVSDELVELIDIAPTLYELLDMEAPRYVQGRSLAARLRNEPTDAPHREYARSEHYAATNFPDKTHATMYRDRRWKLIVYHRKNICELYDLEADPWEHHDLSRDPAYAEVKWELLQKSYDATVYARPAQTDRYGPF
ncbi:MAG: sulfatase-like hydrolase/transferase [Chloroflexota bacterium]|nr:sulfatase-like hydrolase/transferase [Chloroflexota bacterium]